MAAEILGIDILRELEGKVRTEHLKIVKKWSKKGKPLSERHEEVLKEILYADIGRAVVENYKKDNKPIKGIKIVKNRIRNADAYLVVRQSEIAIEEDSYANTLDAAFATELGKDMQGMSVVSPSYGREAFNWQSPPYGGALLGIKFGRGSPIVRDPKEVARERYNPEGRSLQDILLTLPKVHKIENQTYVLDVENTLEKAGCNSMMPLYMQVRAGLEKEKDDPVKRDELAKMYSEVELRIINTQEVENELDD